MKAWEYDCYRSKELVNGFARIFKYDATRGAVNYCSKYDSKDCSKYDSKGGEIDIYPSPEQWHLLTDTEPTLQFIN